MLTDENLLKIINKRFGKIQTEIGVNMLTSQKPKRTDSTIKFHPLTDFLKRAVNNKRPRAMAIYNFLLGGAPAADTELEFIISNEQM